MSKRKQGGGRTSEADFDFFYEEVWHWITGLDLHNWEVLVVHQDYPGGGTFAWYTADNNSRQATIGLSVRFVSQIDRRRISYAAFHEVIHILLSPILFASSVLEHVYPCGYKEEVRVAVHEIIHRLSGVLWEPHWKEIEQWRMDSEVAAEVAGKGV